MKYCSTLEGAYISQFWKLIVSRAALSGLISPNDDIICDRPGTVALSPESLYRACGWHSILHILNLFFSLNLHLAGPSRAFWLTSWRNDLGLAEPLKNTFLIRHFSFQNRICYPGRLNEGFCAWGIFWIYGKQPSRSGPHAITTMAMIITNALKIVNFSKSWTFLTKITELPQMPHSF